MSIQNIDVSTQQHERNLNARFLRRDATEVALDLELEEVLLLQVHLEQVDERERVANLAELLEDTAPTIMSPQAKTFKTEASALA